MDIITVTVEKGNKGVNSYQIVPSGIVISKRPILILLDFDPRNQVGTARPYVYKGVIKAILNIHKGNYLDLYPAIGYIIIKKSGNKVTEFEIRQIGLSKNPNEDATIKTLGEQIK